MNKTATRVMEIRNERESLKWRLWRYVLYIELRDKIESGTATKEEILHGISASSEHIDEIMKERKYGWVTRNHS